MFAAFCGLGIHNVLMYERIFRAMAKQKVVLDVLSYHASASEEDATKLCVSLKQDAHLNSKYVHSYTHKHLRQQYVHKYVYVRI